MHSMYGGMCSTELADLHHCLSTQFKLKRQRQVMSNISELTGLGVRICRVWLARISMTFEPTCGLVGVTCFWAGRSIHVQRSVKSVRRKAKRTHYIERVWECERVFKPHRTRRYGCFSRRPYALFASLGVAALSCTHRSRCGLQGFGAAFTLSSSFSRQALAHSSSLPSQLLPFWRRDNETASATTALRTINLRKCTQLFVNRMF